ncbi:T9SS type A sorting domain-containing protein [Candidatus Poribacteria bacterium]|nr:T9SS type A sorting domain-containing protein [Candidatus Poribacteria bacterium]
MGIARKFITKRLSLIFAIAVLCILFAVPQTQARSLYKHDFDKIAEWGFGDPNNSYSWSMEWYNGKLYVGTSRNFFEFITSDPTVWDNPPVDPVVDPFALDLGAEIWEYDPATGIWKEVYKSPASIPIGTDLLNNFGIPIKLTTGEYILDGETIPAGSEIAIARDNGYRAMKVYTDPQHNEEALYVGATSYLDGFVPFRLLRGFPNEDGDIEFEELQIAFDPVTDTPPFPISSIRSLVEYKGKLYTAPTRVGFDQREEHRIIYEVEIHNGDFWGAIFREASPPGFNDPDNTVVFEGVVFNGYLYAGTGNKTTGFQVWKTDATGDLPYNWVPIITEGAYRGPTNVGVASMKVFRNKLYVGGGIPGGFDMITGLSGPPELIRICKDDRWSLVAGDRRWTPAGYKYPISGKDPGFGNMFNGYMWRMEEHEGWLYLGTFDITTFFLPGVNTAMLPEEISSIVDLIGPDFIVKLYGGFDMWKTRNGYHWYKVDTHGFGNSANYGIRTMKSTPVGLFVGTANPYTQGDTYGNPGGTEVYLGDDGGWWFAPEDPALTEAPESKEFALYQNYPNPWNPETWIPYQLPEGADVELSVFDTSGKLVRKLDLGFKEPGQYMTKEKAIYWDGKNQQGEEVASGVYFYRLTAGENVATRKTIVLK